MPAKHLSRKRAHRIVLLDDQHRFPADLLLDVIHPITCARNETR